MSGQNHSVSTGIAKATIHPNFRIELPLSASPGNEYIASYAQFHFSNDEDAQLFFDANSCNVMSFAVIPNTKTVKVTLHLYEGYTDSWSQADWNIWLTDRCTSMRQNYDYLISSTH